MQDRKRKIDKHLFELVLAQKGRMKVVKLKNLVGLSASSIHDIWKSATWEGWLKNREDYRVSKKARRLERAVAAEQEPLGLVENRPERNFADLFELVEQLKEQLIDLNNSTRELVDWETRKQNQKEVYWAKQREKRSYFSRFGANDE